MTILIFIAFLSGFLTIFSPCILPILPVVLSSSLNKGSLYAFSLTLGIITTFVTLTATFSSALKIFPIDIALLRIISLTIIASAGLMMIFPKLTQIFESLFQPAANFFHKKTDRYFGFFAGFINGVSVGILWTPCAGPILAAITMLLANQTANASILFLLISYGLGVALPLFLFVLGEQWLFRHLHRLTKLTRIVQLTAGMIILIGSILIYTHYDKVLFAKIAPLLPFFQKNPTQLEEIEPVKQELEKLKQKHQPPLKISIPTKPPTSPTIIYISPSPLPTSVFQKAPEISGIVKWFNTKDNQPILLENLRGKVVLLDFWTYTCLPCIPNIDYLKSLQQKYQDQGLVVVSIHTPGYAEAKLEKNVKAAIDRYAVTYPVGMDNDWKTFDAYKNNYWPTEFLIDKEGYIRFRHEGGGEHEKVEEAIVKLLKELK